MSLQDQAAFFTGMLYKNLMYGRDTRIRQSLDSDVLTS
jgi:hypothetical protein